MYVQKNDKVVKVSIRNVKAYFPGKDPENKDDSKNRRIYNLRERKAVVRYGEETSSERKQGQYKMCCQLKNLIVFIIFNLQ